MKRSDLPAIGSPLEGGFHTAIIMLGGKAHALITAPKTAEIRGAYGEFSDKGRPCRHIADGRANTEKMAAEGSETAKKVMAMTEGGFNDWAIPARDQKEAQYRAFKPTSEENACGWRDGENPSSDPIGELYTPEFPAQTTVEAFKEGGEQAFEEGWYLTSTRCSADDAGVQGFSDGDQNLGFLLGERFVRPVRMVPLDD